MSSPAELVDLALDYALRVHDQHDPAAAALEVEEELRRLRVADLRRLTVTLAALVPVDDMSARQLLAWCGGVNPLPERTRREQETATPRVATTPVFTGSNA